ncbi:MAG: cohesin domain-containing protein [Anaerolineae bacterium]
MKTIQLLSVLAFAIMVMAMLVSPAWSQPPEPAVRIEPASIQVDAGSSVQIVIEIHDVVNLGAFQFDLTYDPAIVEVESISLGDFPGSTGRSVNPLGPRLEAGKAVYGAFSFGDSAGPDGSGALATVTLKALGGGQTPLGLGNVQVIDIGGGRIAAASQGATVTVSGSPRPPVERGVESAPTATAVTDAPPALPQGNVDAESNPASPLREWAITAVALLGIVALVILTARLMAR